ncbi:unnamed protein product [Pieris brassicae]|uniref:DUF4371 domain-containing protein n=1 Tax=Pieris brassicae TaxID=7116 RepID=A0A9P0XBW0_PIEBR|nr:unnamed protein product [Pieris brassicae]
MDGSIGCMVNGASLAMATMVLIMLSGNQKWFLDLGGRSRWSQRERWASSLGLSTLLREINPELIVITCIGHLLRLAAEEACQALPRHFDFMVQETHRWFSQSTKPQIEYAKVHKTLSGKMPTKIVKLSNIRRLVRLQAVDATLDQRDALKLHFQITESNKERCYTASQLYRMYCTLENKLFLTFLSNSLKGVMAISYFNPKTSILSNSLRM